MALTPQVRVTQADVMATSNFSAQNVNVSSATLLGAINFPTPFVRVYDGDVQVTAKSIVDVRVQNLHLMAAGLGRVGQPTIRAWTFTLDGHDFYVLRLGDMETLVYDTYSQQWSTWNNSQLAFWRVTLGMNWVGGVTQAFEYGSNITVLDDTYSVIWMLDPDYPYDDDPDIDDTTIRFTRQATGQVPLRGRQAVPCYDVFLTGDVGHPALTSDQVTLSISDDRGNTFSDVGSITVPTSDYNTELMWGSLGQITAPGRLFRVTDNGALPRIDDLEFNSVSEN